MGGAVTLSQCAFTVMLPKLSFVTYTVHQMRLRC